MKTIKKILAVIICLLTAFSSVIAFGDKKGLADLLLVRSSALVGLTQNQAVSWARSLENKPVNVDGKHKNQCTDLVTAYMNYLWLTVNGDNRSPFGLYPYTTYMAYQYDDMVTSDPGLKANFICITRTSSTVPQPGDIFVSEGSPGHVGIVLEPYGNTRAKIIHQNYHQKVFNNGIYNDGEGPAIIDDVSWSQDSALNAQHFIRFKYFTHPHDYRASAEITKAPTKTATGTRVRTCSCGEKNTQTIPKIPYTTDIAEGVYSIKSKADSNLVIATNKSSSYNVFVTKAVSSWSDQYWILIKNSDGTYSFENLIYNNYYIDVYANSMVNGGNIIAYPKKTSNNDNEKFYLVPSGNYYKIVNKKSYNIVDADNPGNGISSGSNVQMFEDLGWNNQLWALKKINPSLALSESSVSISNGSKKTVNCSIGLEMKGNNLYASVANTNICSASWGSWDGKTRPLTITAKATGTTTITVTNKDVDTGIVFATKKITVTVPDTTKPTVSISSTNTVTASQTATLKLADNVGLAGYYWGTNSSYSKNTYTTVSGTSSSPTKTISSAGTYYLTAKDSAGNISSTVSKVFYKTTLNASGGSVSSASVITMSGNSFKLPTPTRSNYAFGNWNTKSDGTGTAYSAGTAFKPTGNITLYAVWTDPTKPSASITSTNNVAASQTATLKLTDNVGLAGYYWGTDSSYSKNTYTTVSGTGKSITKTISSAGTYYLTAKDSAGNVSPTVSKTFYNTTLNTGGGSASPASVITMSGNSFTLPTPARSGYTFLKWNTKPDGTGTDYEADTSYKPTGNTTLYAQWEKVDTSEPEVLITSTNDVAPTQTVTITMNEDDDLAGYYWGTNSSYSGNPYTVVRGKTATITKTVSKAGKYYVTVINSAGQSATKSIEFNETKLYPQGGTVSPETVLSETATTYYLGDGGTHPNIYPTKNGVDFLLPLPEREGYIFKGWNTKEDGTGNSYNAGDLFRFYEKYGPDPISNTKLYAQWEKIHIHSFNEEIIEPTCEDVGYTVITCSCGYVETVDFVSPIGHSFTNYIYNEDATSESDGTETAKCDRCDATDTRIKPGTKTTPEMPDDSTQEKPEIPDNPTQEKPEMPDFNDFNIRNYSSSLSVDYGSTVIFHTNMEAPEGYEIVWSNGQKGSECWLSGVRNKENKISAKMVNQSTGEITAATEEVTVKVNTGFFARITAFFRNLFGSLPLCEDFRKQ